jgi:hypothetical protein
MARHLLEERDAVREAREGGSMDSIGDSDEDDAFAGDEMTGDEEHGDADAWDDDDVSDSLADDSDGVENGGMEPDRGEEISGANWEGGLHSLLPLPSPLRKQRSRPRAAGAIARSLRRLGISCSYRI